MKRDWAKQNGWSRFAGFTRIWIGLAAILVLGTTTSWARADAAPPAPKGPSSRFLLIVETSAQTLRQTNNLLPMLRQFLGNNMDGQIQDGDTLGLWTFNRDVYPGRFPLQDWSGRPDRAAISIVSEFLSTQKYEKKPDFTKVLPPLNQVIADSEFLTIALVTSGGTPIKGTPFDREANEFIQTWKEQQLKERVPFLLVWRAEKGVITSFKANTPQVRIEMPPVSQAFLDAVKAAKAAAEASAASAKPAATNPPIIGSPLIISGKKSSPPPVAAPAQTNVVPVVGTNAQPAVTTPLPAATSNALAIAEAPKPAAAQETAVPAPPLPPRTNPPAVVPEASGPPAAVATAPAAPKPSAPWGVWAVAFGVGIVAVAFVWIRLRRARAGRHVSLITQSLDREEER